MAAAFTQSYLGEYTGVLLVDDVVHCVVSIYYAASFLSKIRAKCGAIQCREESPVRPVGVKWVVGSIVRRELIFLETLGYFGKLL